MAAIEVGPPPPDAGRHADETDWLLDRWHRYTQSAKYPPVTDVFEIGDRQIKCVWYGPQPFEAIGDELKAAFPDARSLDWHWAGPDMRFDPMMPDLPRVPSNETWAIVTF